MEATLVYFSQTGNTRRAAETMAAAFRDLGHSALTVSLKKATPEHATEGDLIGIGSPCFTGQAPTPIKDFLGSLPRLNDKRAFVFATSGGAPGKVLYDLTRLLRHKGADVVGGTLIRGECFHPAPCFIGRYPGRPNADDLARAYRFGLAVAEHVAAGIPGPLPEGRADALKQSWGLYDFEGMLVPDRIVRLVMPKPKLERAKCDKCQWCAYECPVDNITMDPYPSVGGGCIRCYRCLTGCRQEAFRAGWLLGNLVLLSLHNKILERWFGDLEFDEPMYCQTDRPSAKWSPKMLVTSLNVRGKEKMASAAARTLGQMGHKDALFALSSALCGERHRDQAHVREAAAEALGRIGDARATEPLIAGLHDTDKYVRRGAAHALGTFSSARAMEGLFFALKDNHWLVREAAALALGNHRDQPEEASEAVAPALNDEFWQVRRAAAKALGDLGASGALLPLLLALEDEHPVVRSGCRAALSMIIECEDQDNGQGQS